MLYGMILYTIPQVRVWTNFCLYIPEDCEWEYRECGACSATCGEAMKECVPHVIKEAKHGGKQCPGFVLLSQPQPVQCENQPLCQPGNEDMQGVSYLSTLRLNGLAY